MLFRSFIALLVTIAAGLVVSGNAKAAADEPACGMLPPKTAELDPFAGFGVCGLKDARLQPLWKGLKSDKLQQQSRFTFVDGHGRWLWTIRIDERVNGKGRAEVTRIGYPTRSRRRMEIKRHWHRNISKEDMQRFNALTQESQVWQFENGTWDDQEAMYLHCASLKMESVTQAGFRFSYVNIGCNRPEKLKATLEHVLDVSGLRWKTIFSN